MFVAVQAGDALLPGAFVGGRAVMLLLLRCRCGCWVELEALLDHMYTVHGVDGEMERWPDGEPVVYDETLEPADFEGRP